MTTKSEIQDLLRFLSKDAKVPLPVAMGKVKDLQGASLTSPALLAKVSITSIEAIFGDEKLAKQILAAAKRVSKKRPSDTSAPPPSKRRKADLSDSISPAEIERSLILPTTDADEAALNVISVCTNRAPLVLAFAVTVLQYTMPNQPLSSRLSLAQAVVSANSRTKAVSIGLEKGPSADEEGFGQGQPSVRVLGREIRVLRRWGYDPKEGDANTAMVESPSTGTAKPDDSQTQTQTQTQQDPPSPSTIKQESGASDPAKDPEPALWGLDLEALRKTNSSTASTTKSHKASSGMPIHNASPARSYLLRSFLTPASDQKAEKKKTTAQLNAEKERNAACVLRAIDLLCRSWAAVLAPEELDRRAWAWYVRVRPEVREGVEGWGGKGVVGLGEILGLRREG